MDIGKIEQLSGLGPTAYTAGGWTCGVCGQWVTTFAHMCQQPVQQQAFIATWPNADALLLVELQAIKALLEKLVAKAGND